MVIFVAAGTVAIPFKRLIDFVYTFHREDITNRTIIQSGGYKIRTVGSHMVVRQYLTQEQEIRLFRTADVVVTAAGEVSVYLAIKYARYRPIVVPRLARLGEHVDEQQEMIATFLGRNKVVSVLEDLAEYPKLIQQRLPKIPWRIKPKLGRNDLIQSLRNEFGS